MSYDILKAALEKKKQQQHRFTVRADGDRARRDDQHQQMNINFALFYISPRIDGGIPRARHQRRRKKDPRQPRQPRTKMFHQAPRDARAAADRREPR